MKSGRLEGYSCSKCMQEPEQFLPAPKPDFTFAPENAEKVAKAFEHLDASVNYTPLYISLQMSERCNLRCRMCEQDPYKDTFGNFPVDDILRAFDDAGWGSIGRLTFFGGEPLVTTDGRKLLQALSAKGRGGPLVCMVTNGQLLPENMQSLDGLENLQLVLSIDACGESYEKIRAGASWGRLEEALRMVRESKADRLGWRVLVNVVLMRSSLPGLPDLLEKLHSIADAYMFSWVHGDFIFENVFEHPALLGDIPWRESLATSIAVLKDRGQADEAYDLQRTEKRLQSLYAAPPRNVVQREFQRLERLCNNRFSPMSAGGRSRPDHVSSNAVIGAADATVEWLSAIGDAAIMQSPHNRLQRQLWESRKQAWRNVDTLQVGDEPELLPEESVSPFIRGRNIAVWGIGGHYEKRLRPFLEKVADVNVVSLIDGSSAGVTEKDGKPVNPPSWMLGADVDLVLIASLMCVEIEKQIYGLGLFPSGMRFIYPVIRFLPSVAPSDIQAFPQVTG